VILKVLQTLANEDIRVDLFAGVAGVSASESIAEILTTDPKRAAAVLRAADLPVEEVQIVLARLPDMPGSLAQACEALGTAGIHVRSAYVAAVDSERCQQVMIESPEAQHADQLLWALRY
jgi:hypothetical protein